MNVYEEKIQDTEKQRVSEDIIQNITKLAVKNL